MAPNGDPSDASTAPFALSVLTATQGHASKRLVPDANGFPIKDPAHHLGISAGRIQHLSVVGLLGLRDLLAGITHDQALVHGVPKDSTPGSTYQLVKAAAYQGAPGTIARTLDCLAYPEGVRVIMLDYDPEPAAPHPLTSAGDLIARLSAIWPAFSTVGWLATTSTSSAIKSKKTQAWLRPPEGMHVYLLVTGDVVRWRDLVTVRLWLSGEGYGKLATPHRHTGVASLLMRALIDLTVFSPERLDYVAGARMPRRCPFYQDRPAPEFQSGFVLDLDALPDVTDDERQAATAAMSQVRQRLAPEQRRLVREQIAKEPVAPADVEREIDARLEQAERGELSADHPLYFDHGSACTAGTLTAAYDDKRLSDPLEPDYGPNQAVCHWRQGDWRIVSWAHGVRRVFRLVIPEPIPPPVDADDMADLLSRTDADAAADWKAGLSTTNGGDVRETLGNLTIALQHIEPWATQCWYDAVRDVFMVGTEALGDPMVTRAGLAVEAETRMPVRSIKLLTIALTHLCHQHPKDLLREWIESLPPWDGTERLATWLITYAHAPVSDVLVKDKRPTDDPYTEGTERDYSQDVSRLLIESLVVRALNPGCQYRYVVILEGDEDAGKTKLVEAIATSEWYRELSHGLDGKEAHMRIKRAWVAELAELASFGKTEEARLKSFFTLKDDVYVPKFSNFEVRHKRRAVFIGTVNPEGGNDYMRSQTGNTRYLPIPVRDINIEGFEAVRIQLFAEALQHYRDHPDDWWKLSDAGADAAVEMREERRQRSVYEDLIGNWLEDTKRDVTWCEEIATDLLDLSTDRWTRTIDMEISKALKALGWVKGKRERITIPHGSLHVTIAPGSAKVRTAPGSKRVVPWRPGSDWRTTP